MEEELRRTRKGLGWGYGDGVLWEGRLAAASSQDEDAESTTSNMSKGSDGTPSPPATTTSEESFDYMAKGEASMYATEGAQQ
jgi:D-arabinono-1,4-lactone oxidase